MIKSLEKGNLQKVQLSDGQTLFAKTVPATRSLKFYYDKLQPTQVNGIKVQEMKTSPALLHAPALEASAETKAATGKKKGVKL